MGRHNERRNGRAPVIVDEREIEADRDFTGGVYAEQSARGDAERPTTARGT